MRTLKLTIAYVGTRYAGWQIQPPGSRPTIQAVLEQTLKQILQERVRLRASGRTDAGVHAQAQVAHLKTASSMPLERLLRSLNQLLPEDVAVTRIEAGSPRLHGQYRALSKHYRYRIFTGAVAPPFIRPYVHQVRSRLNVARMRRELASIRGRHDFAAFAKAGHGRRSTVRRLSRVSLSRRGGELHLDVEGDGFLYRMVRSIAGTLIDVGRGRLAPGQLKQMLVSGRRDLAGATAPAKGLTLVSVTYPRGHQRRSAPKTSVDSQARSVIIAPRHDHNIFRR